MQADVEGQVHGDCTNNAIGLGMASRRGLLCHKLVGSHAANFVSEPADRASEARRRNGRPRDRPPPAPPATADFGLTRREREVLRLLVAGETDREITEALFVGVRTVEGHAASIHAKLGVRTRTSVASTALVAGLVTPDAHERTVPTR